MHYKIRNDISVATLTRIVCSINEVAQDIHLSGMIVDVQVVGEKDLRIELLPPRNIETYQLILEMVKVYDMPTGALKIVEEDL